MESGRAIESGIFFIIKRFYKSLCQAYEIHYTEEDIKFGFPTTAEKKKKQLSIDSIWNDELFDSEKYQAWEDEWAEFDYHKVCDCIYTTFTLI